MSALAAASSLILITARAAGTPSAWRATWPVSPPITCYWLWRPCFSGTGGDRRLQCARRWRRWSRPLLLLRRISTRAMAREALPCAAPGDRQAPACVRTAEDSIFPSLLPTVKSSSIPSCPTIRGGGRSAARRVHLGKKAKGWRVQNMTCAMFVSDISL
jgi:hypothetical protein